MPSLIAWLTEGSIAKNIVTLFPIIQFSKVYAIGYALVMLKRLAIGVPISSGI